MDDVVIKQHIKHTNNTLIFGELNSNADHGVPSLERAINGQDNLGMVIESLYKNKDNKDTLDRLEVENIGDVTRIFKPTYYFSVGEESVNGVKTLVVEHSLKYRADALPVEITQNSMCFRILASKGKFKLNDLISEIRKNVKSARDHYLAASKSRNPRRLKEQNDLRNELISRLMEPVVAYMLLAESSENYRIIEPQTQGKEENNAEGGRSRKIWLLVPSFEEGDLDLRRECIVIPEEPDLEINQEKEEEKVKARVALETDIRLGKKYLAAAVQGYLSGNILEENLAPDRKELVKALVSSGVFVELRLDDLGKETSSYNLLTGALDSYIESKPELQPEASTETEEPQDTPIKTESSAQVTAMAPANESGDQALATQKLSQDIRAQLENEELKQHVRRIEAAGFQHFEGDDKKQTQISTYLHTFTPIGKIENRFAEIGKRRSGNQELRGAKGFELYLDLCLEDAAEKSQLVRKFRDIFKKTLLQQAHEIKREDEEPWQKFHDHLLQCALATFEDYVEKVSPSISQLIGIDTFLKTAMSADRKPKVLIANNKVNDFLDDDSMLSQLEKFISALNSANLEDYEKAISIVIAPRLEEYYKEQLFDLGYKMGFTTFLTPGEPVQYNDLNDPDKLENLEKEWSNNKESFQSGVLCVPDNILLPPDFRFRLGEYLINKKTCFYALKEPIVVPACFSAAALVARNDDTKFVEATLKGAKLGIKPEWPCIGIGFGDVQFKSLWEADSMSEGVTFEKFLEGNPPLCIFEHSKNWRGQPNHQRVRYLNTLYVAPEMNRPVPVHEYRVAKYLKRVLMLYSSKERTPTSDQLERFSDTKKGIYDERIANSILDGKNYELKFDKKSGYFGIFNIDNNTRATGFDVGIGVAPEQE